MLVIEHLDGRQDYELHLLERRGLLDLATLRVWLEERERPRPPEVPVVVEASEVEDLMTPAGPRGGEAAEMSMRDPLEELADIILYNLDDWLLEVAVREPRNSSSLVTLPVARGVAGNIVETFVVQHLTALSALRTVKGVVRRLPPYLRQIYRLRYRERLTRDEISLKVPCHVRTVDKRLTIIRGRVAARLATMKGDERAGFVQELCRFLRR